MRIYLELSNSKEMLPFNYQSLLTGVIHKWIGAANEIHDKLSLYCFSSLQNARTTKTGIYTTKYSYFFIAAHDENLIKTIIKGILKDPDIAFGVHVKDVKIVNSPNFSTQERFITASPIFIKRKFDQREQHISYDDPNASLYLTETLQNKLKTAGISSEGISVNFDKSYASSKTKLVTYKGVGNKANICPVIIEGNPEQIAFAWNVGIGNSTGIGFGALK
ncbi:MAG: CRISPR-associated endoribonuclease Cas6 [Sphingobacteriaceae bacterium]